MVVPYQSLFLQSDIMLFMKRSIGIKNLSRTETYDRRDYLKYNIITEIYGRTVNTIDILNLGNNRTYYFYNFNQYDF